MRSEPPTGWEPQELGSLCSFRAGSAFKTDRQGKQQGRFPFIKVRDLSRAENIRCINGASNWVDDDDVVALKAKPFSAPTVVFAKIGEALKANRFRVLTCDTLIDNNMMGAIPNQDRVEPEFLYYLLQELKIPDLATGSAMPYLKVTDLKQIRLALPGHDEQKRIAGVLGSLDDKIEANRRIAETLEEIARTLFTARFVDFVDHDDLVESEIGPVPRGWDVVPLSDAVTVNPKVPGVRKGSVVPHVAMADVPAWSVRPTETQPREYAGGARFEPGDTLMARITGCIENGKGAFADFVDGSAAGSTEFLVLRANAPLTPEMVFLLSRVQRVRDHAIANMTGSSGRQRVPTSAFDHLAIAVPPALDAVADEARLFHSIFKRTRTLWHENRTLTCTRDALLPRLVSGQIRILPDAGTDATAA